MSRSLGDLSGDRVERDIEFGYFGATFRVHPQASDLDLVEFMLDAQEVEAQDEVASILALGRYLKRIIHPDDFNEFWKTAKDNGQGLTEIVLLGQRIEAAVAGFPTGQPGDSSPGQQSTKPNLKAVSSQPVGTTRSRNKTKTKQDRVDEATAATFELYGRQGRPDLQFVVKAAEQARQSVAG